MSTVKKREWLRKTTGEEYADEMGQQMDQHAAESPAPPAPAVVPDQKLGRGRAYRHAAAVQDVTRAQASAIGLEDLHVPGGIPHVQNQPAAPHRPLDIGPHADYYAGEMAGGVPHPAPHPHGGRQAPDHWDRSKREATQPAERAQKPREPLTPIPVVIVSEAGGSKPRADMAAYQILVPASGSDPVRLVSRDLTRSYVRICNEDATNGVRIATAQGSCATGYLIQAGDDRRLNVQNEIWITGNTTSAVYVSVLCEYDLRNGA